MFKEPVVFTTTDKAKRDELFRLLRESTDPLERQVTKFSGNEPILDAEGKQIVLTQYYLVPGARNPERQSRPVWRSTWSVSYPGA